MQNGQINTSTVVLVIFGFIALMMFIVFLITMIIIFRAVMKRKRYDPKRGAEMRKIAEQLGWQFTPQAEVNLIPALANFEMFEGTAIKLENLMRGSINGKSAAVFDCLYHNVSARGSGATSSRQTIVFIEDADLGLPMFYLRPEKTLEKALNFISRVDIDFDYRPEFSAKYLLYGHPERGEETRIRHLFGNAQLLEFYEKVQLFCTMGFQKGLFVYQPRSLTNPTQIREWLGFLSHLHNLFRHQ